MLNTPVALSVFNRPDTTESVFRAIARAKPKRLFVFADGPRTADEAVLCEKARRVVERVDWDCDAEFDYSDSNMGARVRYASGVDWVFGHVDEAIILDDDCLPNGAFFPFCQATLERYRDDPRVMMVCGTNYLERWKDDQQSYHFSHFGGVWGWATWRRAWSHYDVDMKAWTDEAVRQRIRELLADDNLFEIQSRRFQRLHGDEGDRHSWDLPWSFARLAQGGLTVVPAVNLVANLGNADGRGLPPAHPLAHIAVRRLRFPLRPPEAVVVDREYDRLHVGRIFDWWQAPHVNLRRRREATPRRMIARLRTASRHVLSRVGRCNPIGFDAERGSALRGALTRSQSTPALEQQEWTRAGTESH